MQERKKREETTNLLHSGCHHVAMSWIWPEEKKGSRLVVDPVRGEGRPHVRSKWLEGVNSLFKNLQASLNNHVSIKDG
jgi:hypothetical protein